MGFKQTMSNLTALNVFSITNAHHTKENPIYKILAFLQSTVVQSINGNIEVEMH